MRRWLLVIAMMLSVTACYASNDPYGNSIEFDRAEVVVGDKTLAVEYANSFEQRVRGLMYRKSLCDDCGMLFSFDPPKQASMWMKNTFVPLDVAFIDAAGVITDIKPLQPHDLTSVGASQIVTYALEMNQGWFAANGIKVGDTINIVTE